MPTEPAAASKTIVNKMVDLIADKFCVTETSSGFWVGTKSDSQLPEIYCPLESRRFFCWLKYQAMELHHEELASGEVSEIVELTIGKNVSQWCQSTDVTKAIEADVTVEAVISWVDEQRSRLDRRPGVSESPFTHESRFESFYLELKDFAVRNHIGRSGKNRFPGSSSVLSRKLNEQAETLLAAGIRVHQPPRDKYGARISISVTGDGLDSTPSQDESYSSIRNLTGDVDSDGSDALKHQIQNRLRGDETA
jgi:hypothetical protein